MVTIILLSTTIIKGCKKASPSECFTLIKNYDVFFASFTYNSNEVGDFMKTIKPKTTLGLYSFVFQTIYIISLIFAISFVKVFHLLNFNDLWWDINAGLIFPCSIISFILGFISIKKYKENSILVKISTTIGFLTIIFLLLHGFFISD